MEVDWLHEIAGSDQKLPGVAQGPIEVEEEARESTLPASA